MPNEDAPTREEVAKALRTLERWGRLGVEERTATPRPGLEKKTDHEQANVKK